MHHQFYFFQWKRRRFSFTRRSCLGFWLLNSISSILLVYNQLTHLYSAISFQFDFNLQQFEMYIVSFAIWWQVIFKSAFYSVKKFMKVFHLSFSSWIYSLALLLIQFSISMFVHFIYAHFCHTNSFPLVVSSLNPSFMAQNHTTTDDANKQK